MPQTSLFQCISSLSVALVVSLLFGPSVSAFDPGRTVLVSAKEEARSFSIEDAEAVAMRLEILTLGGNSIFDSGWVHDRSISWTLGNSKETTPSNGVYLYAISIRDRQGVEHKKLGKLLFVRDSILGLSLPSIGQRSGTDPADAQFPLSAGTTWRQRLGADKSDTLRIQRRPTKVAGGPVPSFENLLQLEADGKLRVKELCLGTSFAALTNLNPDNLDSEGECRTAWGSTGSGGGGTPNGWVDDGLTVRLSNVADKVGIGTNSPTEKLTVAGNIDVTGPMSKISFNYPTLNDLPSPTTYHGMLAHVHATGKAYFAHAGTWVALANAIHTHSLADLSNQDCGTGKAIQGWVGGVLNCLGVGDGEGAANGWVDDGLSVRLATTTDNVGIGTTIPTPGIKLEVNGLTLLTPGGTGGIIQFGTPNTETGMTIKGSNRADVRFDGTTLKLVAGRGGGPPGSTSGIIINTDGKVGIGTTSPCATLHVFVGDAGYLCFTSAIMGEGNGATGVIGKSTTSLGVFGYSGSNTAVVGHSKSGDYIFAGYDVSSNVTEPRFVVERATGNVKAHGSFIPTGVDYADMLPVSGKAAHYEPGDVLVIGSDGKLIKSSRPYSTALAGVYSTKPGVLGDPRGLVENDKTDNNDLVPVALVGLVPVKVSTENGAIHPGDLLTTSSIPGYAMKATDPQIGTVLGKAMQSLEQGTGLISVLVTMR